MMADLTITLVVDETVTGLWCHQCNLPSAYRVLYRGETAGGSRVISGEIHRCHDDDSHVLIEAE